MRESRPQIPIAQGLLFVVITGAIFLLLEGLSSVLLAVKQTRSAPPQARAYYSVEPERRHAQYDRELGWVSIPDLDLPDLYGQGRYLRTEARGFRNEDRVEDPVPEGKLRIVCSGDSFTFGQGVANDRTWCHLLTVADSRFEAVNMGQRGYGVDQAFLWYTRDGRSLDHDIHILAFIDADFSRMKLSDHNGYGKPVLRLERGELTTANVPVPRARRVRPRTSRLGRTAARLRSVQLARWGLGKIREETDTEIREVALEIFHTLRRINEQKDSVLVLVWLPVQQELRGEEARWRAWLNSVAPEEGLLFIDLVPAMESLPAGTVEGFFIAQSATEYIDAAGHYSESGHAWVAEALYARLMELPALRPVLGPSAAGELGAP